MGDSGLEHGEKCDDGTAPMAQGELGFEVDFGHGAVEGGEVEERVIAEAAGAPGGFENQTFDGALRCRERLAVSGGYQDTAVAGGAFGTGHAGEALQEHDVVPDVCIVVGVWGVDEAGVGGKTGGTDAGGA